MVAGQSALKSREENEMKTFDETLKDIEYGHLSRELAEVQQEIVKAVSETNKAGSITLTLSFKPEGNGQLTIKADIKKKIPQLPRGTSLFFMTPEGNIQREDPRQQKLPLKSIEREAPSNLKAV